MSLLRGVDVCLNFHPRPQIYHSLSLSHRDGVGDGVGGGGGRFSGLSDVIFTNFFVNLSLTFIFFKASLISMVRLTCISTQDRCATSSSSNERLRNLLRILLQQSRRHVERSQRGTGGRGEGDKSCRKIRN